MPDIARLTAIGGLVAAFVTVSVVAPQMIRAVADEPREAVAEAIETLFPPPFDARVFRKYAIHFDETVSTDVSARHSVTKIGFGQVTQVSIVTTPTGTYSSDGLVSPHVRYPGIEVAPSRRHRDSSFRFWRASIRAGAGGSSFVFIGAR